MSDSFHHHLEFTRWTDVLLVELTAPSSMESTADEIENEPIIEPNRSERFGLDGGFTYMYQS